MHPVFSDLAPNYGRDICPQAAKCARDSHGKHIPEELATALQPEPYSALREPLMTARGSTKSSRILFFWFRQD